MFSRFRNLFSKSKPEKKSEPEKEPATQQPENAETTNVNTNGNNGTEQTTSEISNAFSTEKLSPESEKVSNGTLATQNTQIESTAEATTSQTSSELPAKVEQITKTNASTSKEHITQESGSIYTESVSEPPPPTTISSGSTSNASHNKDKIEETINKPKGRETNENDSATHVNVVNAALAIAPNNGNEAQDLVKVDKTLNEVSVRLNEVIAKRNENINLGDKIEQKTEGGLASADEVAELVDDQSPFESLNALLESFGRKVAGTPIDSANCDYSTDSSISSNYSHKPNDIYSSSITGDELTTTDISSPADDTLTQSSSPVGAVTSDSGTTDSATIVIRPTGNNAIACMAISNKLQQITEVAESLDAAIRDVQQDAEALEASSGNSTEKKQDVMRSSISEDWQSRSTEDDSFATASECTFTPQSNSSSYHTASGRTSSYISSEKTSFDLSETDDSIFASTYEIPADMNMSYDGSEQSFVSAQQQQQDEKPIPQQQHQQQDQEQQERRQQQIADGAYALPPTSNEDNGDGSGGGDGDVSNSVTDSVEELRSQSVTPTPGDGVVEQYHFQSIPVESESDLDSSCIVDSPSMEVLSAETMPVTSVTPEVSTCSSTELQQQQMLNTNNANTTNHNNSNNTNNNNNVNSNNTNNRKPNAAWRRSKYYENITKQTIKGFL